MKSFCVLSFCLCASLCASDSVDADHVVSRIRAHMLIEDLYSARQEAQSAVKRFPDSMLLHEIWIQLLALQGDECAMIKAWNHYVERFPEGKNNAQLLELMSWGIISKGARSSSPPVRMVATLAAFLGRDVKSVDVIVKALNDTNVIVRGVAVQLSAGFPDVNVRQALLHLLAREPILAVRVEAVRSLGKLRAEEASELLMEIVKDNDSSVDLRRAAIEALVRIFDHVDRDKIVALSQSRSVGLRLLACEVIAYLDYRENVDIITSLLDDHHADVRAAALTVLGLFKENINNDRVVALLEDPDPDVAMAAAWLLTVKGFPSAEQLWERWLLVGSQKLRVHAAAALTATGKYGLPVIKRHFLNTEDPYIKLNLAMGLIGQRDEASIAEACQQLFMALMEFEERWTWYRYGIFRVLIPTHWQEGKLSLGEPEIDNQLARLEVLSILAIIAPDKAQEALKVFLSSRNWGITGVAAALLLQECSAEALDIVRAFINDANRNVSVQAALVLALWGRDAIAITKLQEAYDAADRSLKEKILESLGRIGSTESLPFLVERFSDPYQNLRIIAASSIIQCLNH